MLPTFVVIGAAKAGTTAMYWYLNEHPEVFMSPVKETNFFAYGLDDQGRLLYGDPELHRFPVRSVEHYERLFAGVRSQRAVGEASPIYLECPQSAGRIRDLLPDARIICFLREPVDRAYSDYLMYLRSRGRRLDPARDLTVDAAWAQPGSHWMRISRYHEALQRFYDLFARDRIHVFLFDDLRADALACVRDVYRSVEVDPSFSPDLVTPHNIGGMPSSMTLERILTSANIKRAVEPLIPKRAADAVRKLRTRNLKKAPPLPDELKTELAGHFRSDIRRTAELIGRDLGTWSPT